MPRLSLKVRKIYKAKIVKSEDTTVKAAEPVGTASFDHLSPETENLVNVAAVAEEVLTSEDSLVNPQLVPITSAGIKPPKQPLYYRIQSSLIRPARAKTRRRAVVKAIRQPRHKTTQRSAKSHASELEVLRDGVKIQIHQPRVVSRQVRRRPSRAELINAESKLGSTLFRPIPAGHRREFFHDQENVWIWHEDWLDRQQQPWELTVRYEVRPSGVYKKLSAGRYVKLEGAELENFRQATHLYLRLIKQKLYAYA